MLKGLRDQVWPTPQTYELFFCNESNGVSCACWHLFDARVLPCHDVSSYTTASTCIAVICLKRKKTPKILNCPFSRRNSFGVPLVDISLCPIRAWHRNKTRSATPQALGFHQPSQVDFSRKNITSLNMSQPSTSIHLVHPVHPPTDVFFRSPHVKGRSRLPHGRVAQGLRDAKVLANKQCRAGNYKGTVKQKINGWKETIPQSI